MKTLLLTFILLISSSILSAEAPKYGYIMSCSKNGRVTVHQSNGEIIWEHVAKNCYTAVMLDNGNVLFTEKGGAREVSPSKKTVVEFKESGEVFCARRLKNGDTLLTNSTKNQAVLFGADGKEKQRLQLKAKKKGHLGNRHFNIAPDGKSFIVAQLGDGVVREYDFEGKLLNEFKPKGKVFSGIRHSNGDTYVSWQYGIDIFKKDGSSKTLITLNEKSKPFVHWFTGLAFTDNNQIYATSWLGHKKEGKGPNVMLINADGKVTWQLKNHDQVANATSFTPLTKQQLEAFKKAMK